MSHQASTVEHQVNFQFPPNSSSPQKFTINVDQSFLDLTQRKVADYRPTISLYDEWELEGPATCSISDVAHYWNKSYNWSAVQDKMNSDFDHYAITIPASSSYEADIPLRFIHQRSSNANAVPLLMIHGWPSTNLEWKKVIKPLTENHEFSFHIVAPDLPGFGFSPAPSRPGLGPREMGHAFDALMRKLGYTQYGIVSTDLGWFVGMWMTSDVRKSVLGHMSDFYLYQPSAIDSIRDSDNLTAEERAYIKSNDEWFEKHWTYALAHSRKPKQTALSLGDSPVGFLGWIWDINRSTSDGYAYSFEELITDTMMLWIPGPYANIRFYLECLKPGIGDFPINDVPTGVSEWGWGRGPFPDISNIAFAPVDWIRRDTNLVFFKKHETGGHFPAITSPDLWLDDVREFFTTALPWWKTEAGRDGRI